MIGILIIGGLFGLLAAAAAFLITFEEYSHHYPDKRKPFQAAIRTAGFTLAVFLFLALALGLLLRRMIM